MITYLPHLLFRRRETTFDLTSEFPFGRSAIRERCTIEEDPRRKQHSASLGKRLSFRRIHIECYYRQLVLT